MFSSQAWSGTPPSETLSKVNQAIIRRAIESRFCTAFYAVVHADGQMTYCNAGHNPPMLFTKTGVKRLEKGGTILGLFELATFEEDTITVEPGDILVAFSDGVTEALSASGDEYRRGPPDRVRRSREGQVTSGTARRHLLQRPRVLHWRRAERRRHGSRAAV